MLKVAEEKEVFNLKNVIVNSSVTLMFLSVVFVFVFRYGDVSYIRVMWAAIVFWVNVHFLPVIALRALYKRRQLSKVEVYLTSIIAVDLYCIVTGKSLLIIPFALAVAGIFLLANYVAGIEFSWYEKFVSFLDALIKKIMKKK